MFFEFGKLGAGSQVLELFRFYAFEKREQL
jgi:hypothetical protein